MSVEVEWIVVARYTGKVSNVGLRESKSVPVDGIGGKVRSHLRQ